MRKGNSLLAAGFFVRYATVFAILIQATSFSPTVHAAVKEVREANSADLALGRAIEDKRIQSELAAVWAKRETDDALQRQSFDLVLKTLDDNASVNAIFLSAYTPLVAAASRGLRLVVDHLIREGALLDG